MRSWSPFGSRIRPRLAPLLVFLALAAIYAAGLFEPLERLLMDTRFALVQRAPTGGLVLVEIDTRSLQALDRWPWPRRLHARVLDRLVAAGAGDIAFDIDLSARSSDSEDRA